MPVAEDEQRGLPWACREEEALLSTRNFIIREIVSYGLSLAEVGWHFPGPAAHSQGPGNHSATPRNFLVAYDLFFAVL